MERDKLREALYHRFSDRGIFFLRLRRLLYGLLWFSVIRTVTLAKRLLDFTLALAVLVLWAPVTVFCLCCFVFYPPAIERTLRLGKWGREFHEFSLRLPAHGFWSHLRKLGLGYFPVFFNILSGEMSCVGPRPVSPSEMSLREAQVRKRCSLPPGLVCLWWIRRRANIDYGAEVEADAEYVEQRSMRGDFGILLRAVPAILYGEGVEETSNRIRMLEIPINNLTMGEVLEVLLQSMRGKTAQQICFINADCMNIACRDEAYFGMLKMADYVFADGIGLKLAGKLLNRPVRQNINGTDLFPRLLSRMEAEKKSVYFLGARPEVVEGVASWVRGHYPQLKIAGFRSGYFKPEEEDSVVNEVAASGANLLMVALGAPRQDLWIARHKARLGAGAAVGVGGLFDFYSGRIPRAPQWLREMGMEWTYRLVQEPGRMWKRYLIGNGLFLGRILAEKWLGWRPFGRRAQRKAEESSHACKL